MLNSTQEPLSLESLESLSNYLSERTPVPTQEPLLNNLSVDLESTFQIHVVETDKKLINDMVSIGSMFDALSDSAIIQNHKQFQETIRKEMMNNLLTDPVIAGVINHNMLTDQKFRKVIIDIIKDEHRSKEKSFLEQYGLPIVLGPMAGLIYNIFSC